MIVNLFRYYRFFFMLLLPANVINDIICPKPYSCLTTKDCASRHSATGTQEVLFHCARKSKVCCPPVRRLEALPSPPTWAPETDPKCCLPAKETEELSSDEDSSESEDTDSLLEHRSVSLLSSPSDCGPKGPGNRVTEGENAGLVEFPWMALVGIRYNEYVQWICGGTLINSRYILTAAHCLSQNNQVVNIVRLGEYSLRNKTDCISTTCLDPPQDIPIEKTIGHEEWNSTTVKNDIALLRLKYPPIVTGNKSIHPICLPLKPNELNLTNSMKYEIVGWGTVDWEREQLSDILQKSVITGKSKKECNICKGDKQDSFCPITNKQVCAQGYKKRDVCKGDSGGPLMIEKVSPLGDFQAFQIGITSFKGVVQCGADGMPSLFTRVEKYMKWILDHIEE